MSLCTNTPEGAGEGAAGGAAGGGAGDIPDSAGFSWRQPAIAAEIASKATDAVRRSRCALNDLLQIIRVHLLMVFSIAVATILWRGREYLFANPIRGLTHMIVLRCRAQYRKCVFLGLFLLLVGRFAFGAQETVGVTEIAPNLLVFSTTGGNVVASVGPDGALLVGTPSAASTEQISDILAGRTKSPVRYVVIAPQDLAHSEGDAGWGQRGAFVAMHENALQRLGGDVMGTPPPLDARFVNLGVDRPRIAFSEVLAFDLNGESIHIVHQKPGYSNADAIVHFHVAMLVYMGEAFPGDGYPNIDPAQGGTLDGLLKTLDGWTDKTFQVVPARGKVTNGTTVKAFRDMIVTVRDRVHRMIGAGRTESEVVAEHPTTDFDAQWGHGRVGPDEFVHEVYSALKGR
jgi:cyclase